jgi:cytochrome c oxidase assembly factor CtaG
MTAWRVDWPAVGVALAMTTWYATRLRRVLRRGISWPVGRTCSFIAGVLLYLWCTCGFPNAYRSALLSVWSVQVLTVLLVVPVAIMFGRPVQLASASARHTSRLAALASWRPVQTLAHPIASAGMVPVLAAVLFFAHVPDAANAHSATAAVVDLLLLVIGCLLAQPLADPTTTPTSLAVGAALAISMVELVIDAIPGIVLRLSTHPVTEYFAVRHASWAMAPMADQKLAGAILWGVAQGLDLPFLVIVFRQWIRADEREAAHYDRTRAVADPVHREGSVAGARPQSQPARSTRDAPWWLTDPQMQSRPGMRSSD